MTTQNHSTDGRAATAASPQDPAALRAQLWYPDDDGTLFDEAVRCFEHGAYRAALVMTWLTVAEGFKYRFEKAAERDAELTALIKDIRGREGKKEAIDTFLLNEAGRHGMISAHEKQELAHIRTQRNEYAHPSGKSPTPMQVLAALDAAVRIVLSRPARYRKEWAVDLVRKAATERTFFPRDPDGLHAHARTIDPLLTEDAREHLIRFAFGQLDGLARDPSREDLAERVTILAATILAGHPELVSALGCADRLAKRQLGAALVCLQPEVFVTLDSPLAGAALASLLEPPVGAAADWQPDVRALITVQNLAAECSLPTAWADRLRECIAALPFNELIVMDISAEPIAERLIDELRSNDSIRQNPACRAIWNLKPEWWGSLQRQTQMNLAKAVMRAAENDAMDADWLLNRISQTANQWPFKLVGDIATECALYDFHQSRVRATAKGRVDAILAARSDGSQAIAYVCDIIAAVDEGMEPPDRKSYLDDLRKLVTERPSPLFSAVYDRLSKAPAGS